MTDTQKADPVTLALFANRFMGIAEASSTMVRQSRGPSPDDVVCIHRRWETP